MAETRTVTVEEILAYKKVRDRRDEYFTNLTREGLVKEQAAILDFMQNNLSPEDEKRYREEVIERVPTEAEITIYKKVRDLMDNYFFILALGDSITDEILSVDTYQPPYIPTEEEREVYQKVRKLGDEYFAMLAQCR